MMAQVAQFRLLTISALAGPLLLGDTPGHEPAEPAPAAEVRVVADSALRDIAIAVYHPQKPVIYYNPLLMERIGPELETFFMAHERAHIELRHTRASALGTVAPASNESLQGKELAADCLASRRLAVTDRAAALAAVRFFTRQGDTAYDAEHPTGTRRAARILACLGEG